jgi:hypothetical protein
VFKLGYRYRKYVWMVMGVLAAILVYLLVFNPLFDRYQGTLDRIDMAKGRLERSRQLVEQQEHLDRQIKQMEAALKRVESSMFQGDTTSLVGAQMQEIMDGIFRKSGADIRQTRVLKGGDLGPYKEIRISVDMISSLDSLAKIIFDLNHNSYFFMISELSSRSTGKLSVNNVRTRMTVMGLMREKSAG